VGIEAEFAAELSPISMCDLRDSRSDELREAQCVGVRPTPVCAMIISPTAPATQ
jgi:hypothetical protein